MRELTAVMSLLLAVATSLAVFAAAQPDAGRQPVDERTAIVTSR